jgi:hypothetical protein
MTRRPGARPLVLAALVLVAGMLVPAVAEAQVLPSVSPASLPGAFTTVVDCDGSEESQALNALLKVERDGTLGDLVVDLSYSGDMVLGTDFTAPEQVTIPNGETQVVFEAVPSRAGTFELTVDQGVGYVPGDPATTTVTIQDNEFRCQRITNEQTIPLGGTPAKVEVPSSDSIFTIEGDVPPGLSFDSLGGWAGAATELGTFRFTGRWCLGEGEAAVCAYVADVTIHVVPEGTPVPDAVAAQPVAATPTFTG